MTIPQPPMALTGHCSAIYNNTLYVYTPDGFASISLEQSTKQNTTWTPLTPGVAVTGAACVSAAIEGNKDSLAFYVVGGTGNSSTYSGIQRFSYKEQKWSNLTSAGSGSLQNRTSHGIGYLESSASILMYGGDAPSHPTADGSSQDTFTISTTTPYTVKSFNDQGAPTAANPMLLTWNQSAVALLGGSSSNTNIYIYGDSGWTFSGATLDAPVASALSSTNRCALAIDDDGNKILQEFNLDVSPNTVTSYEMMKKGEALSPATHLTGSTSKRSFSVYPSYNNSNAPTSKKSDYSVAQGSNNLVVLSGGSGDNSLSIFNQSSNDWVNATELFYVSNSQNPLHGTTTTASTTSTTPSSTASSSATSSPAAAASGNSGEHIGLIIGATLGSICGAIVILVAILFLLRRSRLKQNQDDQGHGGAGKDRLSFQDQGIEPLTGGAYPMAKSPVPVATVSDDSLAIMSGRYAGEKSLGPPSQNYGYGLSKNSPLSTIPSSGIAPSSMYSDDSDRSAAVAAAVEAISSPGNKPGDRTTDEGWGKYFEDNSATNLAGMPSDRSTVSSVYTRSDYRGSAWPMTNLAPLNHGFLDQRPLGRVASGNPATENTGSTDRNLIIPESQSARISSADSVSVLSDDDPHDTNWTGAGHSSWLGRPTSSNYSTSFYNSSNTNLPAANPQHGFARYSNGRKSSVVIPDDIDELPHSGTMNSDMSWLNLHADR
ncbi:hypothetical protein N7478_005256 [Penicillium angulare]|uniref:uncharacterized protein n=1 Tax=Penicillium angulare TaxID=116970 RepID=UPI0025406B55|nr:uncharacterized protein N7478_005256 [Penicillium angulare]KAJ5279884.1 hypothetical protein N7478_005256 [Penicillium angulare]